MFTVSEKEKLISFRHSLHSEPELSHSEKRTAQKIADFISQYSPAEIITGLGGNGIAAIFNGTEKGKVILFRSELDALPIKESNEFEYKSLSSHISHKCGHDGHMTILAGLTLLLNSKKFNRGSVVLLFQPAEETGEGAELVLNDSKFTKINPDYVFALHNLPGYERNSVILKEGNFASASKGMIVKLLGKTSHAAEPENGINPALAMSEIIQKFSALNDDDQFKEFTLITIIHSRLGEKAFGTSPGYAEIMATLRSFQNEDIELLTQKCESLVSSVSEKHSLRFEISYTEVFPVTSNDKDCVRLIEELSIKNNLKIIRTEEPFRWSEDFGHFTSKYKGGLFGLGAGVDSPQLHNSDYDFPDDLIFTGAGLFYSLANKILNDN